MAASGRPHSIIATNLSAPALRLKAPDFGYTRITRSSLPTVETNYPRAKTVVPKIASTLRINPTQMDRALAHDITQTQTQHISVGSRSSCEHDRTSNTPSLSDSPSCASFLKTSLRRRRKSPNSAFFGRFRYRHNVIFAVPPRVT